MIEEPALLHQLPGEFHVWRYFMWILPVAKMICKATGKSTTVTGSPALLY
jgi:hypothetical protein